MSEQENTQIVRRVYEYLNSHNLDSIDQYLTDDAETEATGAMGIMDKQQNHMYNHTFMAAFPDLHFDLTDTIAQGDRVATAWVVSGTHTAPLAMPNGDSLPPTNRRVTLPGCTIAEFRGGKVSRQQIYWDQLSFLNQLGVVTDQDIASIAKARH
jgi:steroid delta-isomerase-like uncharacterized protein